MTYHFRDRTQSTRSAFIRSRKAETRYAAQLRKVAKQVGDIIKAFPAADPASLPQIDETLRRYSEMLGSWGESVANRMLAEIADRDRAAWMEVSRKMGRALREEIETAPTGQIMRERLSEQVKLIKSIPTEAAERVRKLTNEEIVQGARADQIAKEIMRSGEVAKSRANTIARTEVSRTATELTKARAQHIGSTHFIWHTAGDSEVRHDHRVLNGKTFSWDDPPVADQRTGAKALPGGIYNCRCWAEPIVEDE